MENNYFDFGMIGLGVMGRNFLLNMADHGFSVIGFAEFRANDRCDCSAVSRAGDARHRSRGRRVATEGANEPHTQLSEFRCGRAGKCGFHGATPR